MAYLGFKCDNCGRVMWNSFNTDEGELCAYCYRDWENKNLGSTQTKRKVDSMESYKYRDYTLYKSQIVVKTDRVPGFEPGKIQYIYFFSNTNPVTGEPSDKPSALEIFSNNKTGWPFGVFLPDRANFDVLDNCPNCGSTSLNRDYSEGILECTSCGCTLGIPIKDDVDNSYENKEYEDINDNKINAKFSFCPYCGKEFNLPKQPNFCPYCKEKL